MASPSQAMPQSFQFDYIKLIIKIYRIRSDLQKSFPEAANGEISGLLRWASNTGFSQYPNILRRYSHIYKLMRIYYSRPDLQKAFPEAANGELAKLFDWASYSSELASDTKKYEHIYKLMRIYYSRPDLQKAFPEAANGEDIKRIIEWAATESRSEDALAPFSSIFNDTVVQQKLDPTSQ